MKKVLQKLKSKLFGEKGFSLLELLITLGILSILLVTITNIITVNLKVSRMVMARTYVREETGFLLKILKKDIRNAESAVENTGGYLEFQRVDRYRTRNATFTYRWRHDTTDMSIKRERLFRGWELSYALPDDIEIGEFSYDVISSGTDNAIVRFTIRARTDGMPEDSWITKIVAISTRNYV